MPTYPLSRTAFEQEKAAGQFHPLFTWADYQQMLQERAEIKRAAEEAARHDGYELGAPELDLSPEDEAILDRVWAQVAAEKARHEQEVIPPLRAA